MRFGVGCIVGSIVLCAAAQVIAQDASQLGGSELDLLQSEIVHARFRSTLPRIEAFLARRGLEAEQRNRALEMLAVVHLALRQEQEAEKALDNLYKRDPEHRLTQLEAGPMVQAAFSRAREQERESLRVMLHLEKPNPGPKAGPLSIQVRVSEGANAVHELRLWFRDARGEFVDLLMSRPSMNRARAEVPLLQTGGSHLEYFVEAVAPSGYSLALLGATEHPLKAELPNAASLLSALGQPQDPSRDTASTDEDGGIASKWWFWSAVGLVVTGAVAGYVLWGLDGQSEPASSLGEGALQ